MSKCRFTIRFKENEKIFEKVYYCNKFRTAEKYFHVLHPKTKILSIKKRRIKNLKRKTEMKNTQKKSLLGYLPKENSIDPQERKDALWLNKMRKAKKAKSNNWHPVLDEDAKKYGLDGIFDMPEEI